MRQIIPILVVFWKNDEHHRFHRLFTGILFLCVILIIYANTHQLRRKMIDCKLPSFLFKESSLKSKQGPPYLTYIISAIPGRFNLTRTSLETRLPGYFKIHQRRPVPHDDRRIRRFDDLNVSSLLLTHIDLWSQFGWNDDQRYGDHDWFFVFEDDVDILPLDVIEELRQKNQSVSNVTKVAQSLAGKSLDIFEV